MVLVINYLVKHLKQTGRFFCFLKFFQKILNFPFFFALKTLLYPSLFLVFLNNDLEQQLSPYYSSNQTNKSNFIDFRERDKYLFSINLDPWITLPKVSFPILDLLKISLKFSFP